MNSAPGAHSGCVSRDGAREGGVTSRLVPAVGPMSLPGLDEFDWSEIKSSVCARFLMETPDRNAIAGMFVCGSADAKLRMCVT